MITRANRSVFAQWWWTIDRWLLFFALIMMVLGVLLAFAASPSVARDLRIYEYHFVQRQILFAFPAMFFLLFFSFLNERWMRRLSLIGFIGGCFLIAYTLFFGVEIKGATRWISLLGFSLQPSELVKPFFVILSAWLFAEGYHKPEIHGHFLAICLYAFLTLLLILQPDIGQTLLVTAVWCALFFMTGLQWIWIFFLMGVFVAVLVMAYLFFPHVTQRIDRFIDPSSGDTYQVDRAMDSFLSGGWFGRGPGEGTVKRLLPDSHTDFIFAVIGEEFGIIACLIIVMIFSVFVCRGLYHAFKVDDLFRRLAIAGLTILIGVQAAINMGVNLQLLPAKGMTLPFLSYGGSSLFSASITIGLLIALTKRRYGEKNAMRNRGIKIVYAH